MTIDSKIGDKILETIFSEYKRDHSPRPNWIYLRNSRFMHESPSVERATLIELRMRDHSNRCRRASKDLFPLLIGTEKALKK